MKLNPVALQSRPVAALHELIRQFSGSQPDFELVSSSLSGNYLQLVGAGLLRRAVVSFAGEGYPTPGPSPVVARALAAKPRVMLLDEPFGALDPLTRGRLQASFIRIRRDLGVTAVFVTHDMVEALRLGDRIAVLHNGCLVQVGTPGTLLREPANDYVRQLLDTPRREARLVDSLLSHGPGTDSR